MLQDQANVISQRLLLINNQDQGQAKSKCEFPPFPREHAHDQPPPSAQGASCHTTCLPNPPPSPPLSNQSHSTNQPKGTWLGVVGGCGLTITFFKKSKIQPLSAIRNAHFIRKKLPAVFFRYNMWTEDYEPAPGIYFILRAGSLQTQRAKALGPSRPTKATSEIAPAARRAAQVDQVAL